MKSKKHYLKNKATKQIVRLNYIIKLLIGVMSIIVVYDSFVHQTPLYYIIFFFAGLIVGRIFIVTQKVETHHDSSEFGLVSSRWNVLIILLLIFFRFIAGKWLLEELHVVWPADAMYLFFIGIYRTRWKSIVHQVDEKVYQFLAKKEF
jgi:uncharacterized membrane protein